MTAHDAPKTHMVSTVQRPDVEFEVDQREHDELKAQGLLSSARELKTTEAPDGAEELDVTPSASEAPSNPSGQPDIHPEESRRGGHRS